MKLKYIFLLIASLLIGFGLLLKFTLDDMSACLDQYLIEDDKITETAKRELWTQQQICEQLRSVDKKAIICFNNVENERGEFLSSFVLQISATISPSAKSLHNFVVTGRAPRKQCEEF